MRSANREKEGAKTADLNVKDAKGADYQANQRSATQFGTLPCSSSLGPFDLGLLESNAMVLFFRAGILRLFVR